MGWWCEARVDGMRATWWWPRNEEDDGGGAYGYGCGKMVFRVREWWCCDEHKYCGLKILYEICIF